MRLFPRAGAVFRAAALASILVCSCGSQPAALVLSLHTNDLAISADTNLVGLYISQIAADGTVIRVDAHEAAPLRDDTGVKVPFPASLVLVSGEQQTAVVHVRLVAYRGSQREVLTMRESRTRAPTRDEASRLLRLDLFFTNQGNVVDATPGAPLAAAGASLGATGENLALQNRSVPITQQDFDRFTSICDGGPAPVGKTSDERGHCTELLVELTALPEFDPQELVPGANEDDLCYDVEQAFTETAPGAPVVRIEKSALAASGECRIALPARYDARTLNVALLTSTPTFPLGNTGKSVRPLAASIAFQLQDDGATLSLPANVCMLARRDDMDALLLSPRTDAWGGAEPVCAPWVNAAKRHSFDKPGPAPLGDRDGGSAEGGLADAAPDAPDGAPPPSFSDYSVSIAETFLGMAQLDGEVALLQEPGNEPSVVVVPESAFHGVTPSGTKFTVPGGYEIPSVRALRLPTGPAYYVQDLGYANVAVVDHADGVTIGSQASGPMLALQLPDGTPTLAYFETVDSSENLRISELTTASTLSDDFRYDFTQDLVGSPFLEESVGVFVGPTFYVPNWYSPDVWTCVDATCSSAPLLDASLSQLETSALWDGVPLGLYRTVAGTTRFVNLATRAPYTGELTAFQVDGRLVAGGIWACIHRVVDATSDSVTCFDGDAIAGTKAPLELLGGVETAYLDGDATFLYVAYKCSSEASDPVHVARIPWADISASSTAFVNRCAVDGGPP